VKDSRASHLMTSTWVAEETHQPFTASSISAKHPWYAKLVHPPPRRPQTFPGCTEDPRPVLRSHQRTDEQRNQPMNTRAPASRYPTHTGRTKSERPDASASLREEKKITHQSRRKEASKQVAAAGRRGSNKKSEGRHQISKGFY
jgi:hypothetical protein